MIKEKPDGAEPKHLLWCMLFLKNYHKEHVNASIAKVDEKTFRLWVWRFIKLLAQLDVVYDTHEKLLIRVKFHNILYAVVGKVGKLTQKFGRTDARVSRRYRFSDL